MNLDNDSTRQLQEQLRLKELAIEEMSHRFRNQLQIISNLLDIQAARTSNREVLDALTLCRTRVASIALVHDVLKPGDSAEPVSLQKYLKAVVAAVSQAWQGDDGPVQVKQEIAAVRLPAARAAVLGLIVTELLTNAFRHAFTSTRKGTITVELLQCGTNLTLVVTDDGRGLPPDSLEKTASGGLRLVKALTAQLNGAISCNNTPGARFTIAFPALNPL